MHFAPPTADAGAVDRLVTQDLRMKEALRNVNLFVLDNSVRETTVGSLRGHSLEAKIKILAALKPTGLEEIILGAFGASENVDDHLPQHWQRMGGSLQNMWGFTEAWDKAPTTTTAADSFSAAVPAGMLELQKYRMSNAIIEVDTCNPATKYDDFSPEGWLVSAVLWANSNLTRRGHSSELPPRTLINLRDFANYEWDAKGFRRGLDIVAALGRMPEHLRPLGIMIEEPTGFLLPLTLAKNVAILRRTMNEVGWVDAKLLVHVHNNFGLADAATMEAIGAGADGLWGAVCRPGAHLGHCCSAVTLTNLSRLGNRLMKPYVGTVRKLLLPADPIAGVSPALLQPKELYDLPAIVKAARIVHEIATMAPVPATEEVYGPMAFDVAFHGWHGFCQDEMNAVARSVGAPTTKRVTDFSSWQDIHEAMTERFGPSKVAGWTDTEQLMRDMKTHISTDLLHSNRFDYNTPVGLAQLYESAGGRISKKMLNTIVGDTAVCDRHPLLITIKTRWFALTRQRLHDTPREAIYHDTRNLPLEVFLDDVLHSPKDCPMRALLRDVMDIDDDEKVSWDEFCFRLKWCMVQRGPEKFSTPEQLIDAAFEMIRQRATNNSTRATSSDGLMMRNYSSSIVTY